MTWRKGKEIGTHSSTTQKPAKSHRQQLNAKLKNPSLMATTPKRHQVMKEKKIPPHHLMKTVTEEIITTNHDTSQNAETVSPVKKHHHPRRTKFKKS